MCGIAGYLNLPGLDESAVLSRLAHRGPDGSGSVEIAPGSRLLHARLSIIDLSDAGRQPMRDPGSGNVVVFNGEIYNYRALREELTDPDEPWRSHSDTEVILRAWRRWGMEMSARLRGMFALALWDASSRVLWLVRDRYGIKPLYFARNGRSFAFASEVRALMATGIVERRIDPARLGEYLRFQSALGAGGIVEGVGMLGPGCVMQVSGLKEQGISNFEFRIANLTSKAGDRGISNFGFRNSNLESKAESEAAGGSSPLNSKFEIRNSKSSNAAAAEIAAAFDDAVRVHLESDVPVGAFLSGGLDSTAIVGTLKHIGGQPRTFTVCWDDGDDESVAARRAAELAGAEHHEVRLSHDEVLRMIPEAVAAIDSPSADGVNSYIVSRAVRQQGLKVALSGLGGDELFGGYPSFTRARSFGAKAFRATPRSLRWPLGAAASAVAGYSTQLGKAGDLLRGPGTLTDLYLEGRALFSRDQVVRLTGRAAGEHPARASLLSLEASLDGQPGTFISHAEMMTYMHDTLLRDTDQMSMAHGLEVRVPFLDGKFADLVLGLSDQVKFDASPGTTAAAVTKPLLVKAFADRIPAELHGLPKKGFSLPMRQWMRGPLRDYCLERIRSSALKDAGVDGAAAMEVWKAFEDDRARWSRPWALVVLADWSERNL